MINEALRSKNEINERSRNLLEKGLSIHPTCPEKSWDLSKAIKFIDERAKGKNVQVLDLGSGLPGELLVRLRRLGYRKLYGCDLKLVTGLRSLLKFIYFNFILGLNLSRQDIEHTSYKKQQFDFVISLSVIEHGIDLLRFFSEASRILKTGGYLIVSCDYWPLRDSQSDETDPFDRHLGKARYFTEPDIENMVSLAKEKGLSLIEPLDFSIRDRLVKFSGNIYTFIFFILQKL